MGNQQPQSFEGRLLYDLLIGLPLAVVAGVLVFVYTQGRPVQPPVTPELPPTSEHSERSLDVAPYFTVKNELERPIKVFVDDVFKGEVNSLSTETFLLDNYPVDVKWEVIPVTMSNGVQLGDYMSDIIYGVTTKVELDATNYAKKQLFFYPIITNKGSHNCEFSVNDGGTAENRPGGYVNAYSDGVALGYYRLYSNSNVTLYCDHGIFHWGNRPVTEEGPGIINLVTSGSGVFEGKLDP